MKNIFFTLIGVTFLAFANAKSAAQLPVNCGYEERKIKILEYEETVKEVCNQTIVEDCKDGEINQCTEVIHDAECPCKESLQCQKIKRSICKPAIRKRWVTEDTTVCIEKTDVICIQSWVEQEDGSKVWQCPDINPQYKTVVYEECSDEGTPFTVDESYTKCEEEEVDHCEIVQVDQVECKPFKSYNCKKEPITDCPNRLKETCWKVHTREPVTKFKRVNIKVCTENGNEVADAPPDYDLRTNLSEE